MSNNFEDVAAFHEKYGLEPNDDMTAQEYYDLVQFRIKFLREEFHEFIAGYEEDDHAQMFDALLDLVYVAMGTAYLLQYPWQEGWDLVQAANMSKVRALHPDESKRSSAWDVIKPDGWQAPDIKRLLQDHGFDA